LFIDRLDIVFPRFDKAGNDGFVEELVLQGFEAAVPQFTEVGGL
jgi:hypothetical protein